MGQKLSAMTLVVAFRSLGVLIGDPNVDAERQRAADVLLSELSKLVRSLDFPRDMWDDAIAEAFCSLMTGGNRTNAAVACDSDARVRGFLRQCLRNAMRDERRKGRRLSTLDAQMEDSVPATQQASPEQELSAWEEIDLRRSAQQELYDQVVPALVAKVRPSARRDLTQAIEDMRALAAGEKDFGAVVFEATGRNDGPAQSAVHQRHSRTRRRLLEYIESLEVAGELSTDRVRALCWCVSRLQRRAS